MLETRKRVPEPQRGLEWPIGPALQAIFVARGEVNLTRYGGFNEKDIMSIARELKTNTTVHTINLSVNHLGAKVGVAIAELLKTNTTLREIRLSKCNLDEEGGVAIAEALKVNTTLKTICLDGNYDLGEKGGVAIAEALKVNTTLQAIGLYACNLGEKGGVAIAEALKVNTTLRTINLCHNNMGKAGGDAIVEALKINETLMMLEIENSNSRSWVGLGQTITNYETTRVIRALLERNQAKMVVVCICCGCARNSILHKFHEVKVVSEDTPHKIIVECAHGGARLYFKGNRYERECVGVVAVGDHQYIPVCDRCFHF
jgi:hypothetical protein